MSLISYIIITSIFLKSQFLIVNSKFSFSNSNLFSISSGPLQMFNHPFQDYFQLIGFFFLILLLLSISNLFFFSLFLYSYIISLHVFFFLLISNGSHTNQITHLHQQHHRYQQRQRQSSPITAESTYVIACQQSTTRQVNSSNALPIRMQKHTFFLMDFGRSRALDFYGMGM